MVNIKPTVVAALKGDAALTGLLGGAHVYYQYDDNKTQFPRVTYYMLDDQETAHAMGYATVEETKYLSVDIWSKGSTSAIADRVDALIKGMGYFATRETCIDMYEKDTKVHRKHMVYEIRVTL